MSPFSLRALSLAVLLGAASPLSAQDAEYDYQPVTAPISVARGTIEIPAGQDSYWLNQTETCKLATQQWGWGSCTTIDSFVVFPLPEVDSTLIEKPNSEGYVKMEDWDSGERATVIKDIEDSLRQGAVAQGAQLGETITFDGWLVEPTLNTDKHYMYYASRFTWAGQPQINIKATVFDRRGYVAFSIIPVDQAIAPEAVEGLINASLDQYKPAEEEAYAAFTTGDTVAAVGAVGVLATLAGLQYSKGATGGLIAAALLILKKAWFILLAPLIWLKSKFSRKSSGGDGPGAA